MKTKKGKIEKKIKVSLHLTDKRTTTEVIEKIAECLGIVIGYPLDGDDREFLILEEIVH